MFGILFSCLFREVLYSRSPLKSRLFAEASTLFWGKYPLAICSSWFSTRTTLFKLHTYISRFSSWANLLWQYKVCLEGSSFPRTTYLHIPKSYKNIKIGSSFRYISFGIEVFHSSWVTLSSHHLLDYTFRSSLVLPSWLSGKSPLAFPIFSLVF